MKQFYVYLHCRPDGSTFYVGKGSDKGRVKKSHKFSVRNPYHKSIVAKCGGKENIEVIIFPSLSEDHSFKEERILIKFFGRHDIGTGCLANMTDGGDGKSGWVPSEDERKKRSVRSTGNKYCLGKQNRLGYKASAETCAKMSASRLGKPSGRLGKKHTPETLAKMAAGNSRPETRAKRAAWQIGRKLSAEHCNNLSVSHQGKPWSPARRAAQEAKK